MKGVKTMILAFCLAACGNLSEQPEVAKCEQQILSNLANPDSYERGQHDSLSIGDYWQVGIEYSYRDSDGNQVSKAWQICDYPLVDGKPDIFKFLKLEGSAD